MSYGTAETALSTCLGSGISASVVGPRKSVCCAPLLVLNNDGLPQEPARTTIGEGTSAAPRGTAGLGFHRKLGRRLGHRLSLWCRVSRMLIRCLFPRL